MGEKTLGQDTVAQRTFQITANKLKLIAIAAMVVDHCAIVFVPHDFRGMWLLRMIGRMTAPIMCYFIAEGYYHTSNLKKYMGRLLLMALVSHVPHNLCLGQNLWQFWNATDVMFSLLFGLIALAAWKQDTFTLWAKIAVVAVCCLLAYSADWNYIGVLWILGFGVFHGDARKQLAAFLLVDCIYFLQPLLYGTSMPYISRLGVLLVIPLLFLYKGERGRKSNLIKWGFYWFYPLHFLVIYGFSRFV